VHQKIQLGVELWAFLGKCNRVLPPGEDKKAGRRGKNDRQGENWCPFSALLAYDLGWRGAKEELKGDKSPNRRDPNQKKRGAG